MSQTTDAPSEYDDVSPDEALADSSMQVALEEETGIVWDRFAALILLLFVLLFLGGLNMLAFVGALAAALIVHEAGHYLVARWSGMKVTEFFIGFGPRIFSFKRGETTYGVKVGVPLGAYVRIIGMNNLETVDPAEEHRTYRHAPWHKRVLTILAGPATHFIVAIGLMAVLLWQDGFPVVQDDEDLSGPWSIAAVVPFSAAENADLQERDQILSIDGVDTASFASLTDIIPNVQGEVVEIEYLRDGEPEVVDVRVGERLTGVGAEGYSGLYEGDLVVGFDGEPVANYAEFASLASERLGESVEVSVVYGASEHTELITINEVVTNDAVEGFLGVARGPVFEQPRSLGDAFVAAPGKVGTIIEDIATRTPRLVTTRDGLRGLFGLSWIQGDVATPNETIVVEDDTVRPRRPPIDENRPISLIGATRIADSLEDPYQVVFLLIALNLFFGMFNLVPLLPLDGGHIALATYERIRSIGRDRYEADAAKLLPITYFVVMIVLFVGGMAMLRDIFDPIEF